MSLKVFKASLGREPGQQQIPAITYTTTLDDFYTTTFISPQVESFFGFSPADFH